MENLPHVVTGLLKKRAELAGAIEAAQAHLRQLMIDIDNVDYTIRLFKPDVDLEEIRPKPLPPRHAAFKGEVARCVFNALKEANGPLTSRDLAERLMTERGMNASDLHAKKLIQKRVGAGLKHYRNRGLVRVVPGKGSHKQFLLWELVR